MEIVLNISRHCIETASRKEYERLIAKYFQSAGTDRKKVIEVKISALKYFLEKADFFQLRDSLSRIDSNDKAVLIVPQHFKDIHILYKKTLVYPKLKDFK